MYVRIIQCLGLYEECYSLLRDNVIGKDDFLSAHLWLLEKILENKDVQIHIIENKKYWKRLYKLVEILLDE